MMMRVKVVGISAITLTMAFSSQTSFGMSLDENIALMNRSSAAMQSGNWDVAAAAIQRMVSDPISDIGHVAVNDACNRVQLFMLRWNLGQRSAAMSELREAIRIMDGIGEGCSASARRLLAKAETGRLPDFTYVDMNNTKIGVIGAVMAVPSAVWNRQIDGFIARQRALGAMFDSQTSAYRREGDRFAWREKYNAASEYQRKTGRTFDPSDRPSYDSPSRAEWDACKKVYDIFE